jgi:hypothetical protein
MVRNIVLSFLGLSIFFTDLYMLIVYTLHLKLQYLFAAGGVLMVSYHLPSILKFRKSASTFAFRVFSPTFC